MIRTNTVRVQLKPGEASRVLEANPKRVGLFFSPVSAPGAIMARIAFDGSYLSDLVGMLINMGSAATTNRIDSNCPQGDMDMIVIGAVGVDFIVVEVVDDGSAN